MSPAGWVAITVIALMIVFVVQLGRPRSFSEEEFEKESKRPSLLRTGLQEFQGFLEPTKKVAIEVVEKEKRKTNQEATGDPPQPETRKSF